MGLIRLGLPRRRGIPRGRRNQPLDPMNQTLEVIRSRIPGTDTLARRARVESFNAWFADMYEDPAERRGIIDDPPWLREEVGNWLSQELSVTVREDGLIEFWILDPLTEHLIRGLPVVLYHHTATGKGDRLLRTIKEEGLRSDVPRRADVSPRNTGAGVYLTSDAGSAVAHAYKDAARRAHGGDTITLEVVVGDIDDLYPDPDDEDIGTGKTQWVVRYVPPGAILWDE